MTADPVIHIVDDDEAMRDSLSFLLEVQGYRVRVYDSALTFLATLNGDPIDCVVTDIRMPGMTGLELVRKLKDQAAECPVIVMTGHGDVPLAVEAMKAGVVDFIEKPFSNEDFIAAISAALESRAGSDAKGVRSAALEKLEGLSPREREVLMGIVAGKMNKMIAFELEISPRTVEIYRANLMSKTGARNVSELMRLALSAGL
jgi:two-component system response regulator FixJ